MQNFFMSFVTNFAFSNFFFDNLHTSLMITMYNLENIQNKAQKACEKFEEKNIEEVSV